MVSPLVMKIYVFPRLGQSERAFANSISSRESNDGDDFCMFLVFFLLSLTGLCFKPIVA